MSEESPYIQGVVARSAGQPINANPYDPELASDAFQSWDDGWQTEDGTEHILSMSDADLEASVGPDEIAAAGVLGRELLAKARAAINADAIAERAAKDRENIERTHFRGGY